MLDSQRRIPREWTAGFRAGPLGPHIDAFVALLLDAGYARSTVRTYLWCLADFGRWMIREGVRDELDDRIVDAFVETRRRQKRLHRSHRAALGRLLEYLREQGIAATPQRACTTSPAAQFVSQYEQYLSVERGLTPATLVRYRPFIRRFLEERFGDQPLRLQEVAAADLSSFVVRQAPSMSPASAKLMVGALRSFFRFLLQRGYLEADLAGAVPRVANWRLATIPKYLPPEDIDRLLNSCDRSTARGRRDYAVLILLARLGLRAGEIVALELDDIRWKTGELLVRGKGLLHERLPLLREVGEALVEYLRHDRARSVTRRVFLRMRAPSGGFRGASTVTTIVRRALERAGVKSAVKGAHLLRHSLATGMLRHGASMAEIGDVLRHRSPSTTEIYAKVDLGGLRSLALPWPVAGGGQ
jgi:site-specific recombinase XerD